MKKLLPMNWAAMLVPALVAGALNSGATVVVLEYSSPFESGGAVYSGTAPFLRATLSDSGPGSTSVHFLLEPHNIHAGDFVNNWGFNFSGDATDLVLGSFTKVGTLSDPTFQVPAGVLGGGNPPLAFSLAFSVSNAGGTGAQRFGLGETLEFDLSLIGGGALTVHDFLEPIVHQGADLVSGVFFAGDSGSFHYGGSFTPPPPPPPVPEPTTFAFAGLLALGLTAVEIRRRRKTLG